MEEIKPDEQQAEESVPLSESLSEPVAQQSDQTSPDVEEASTDKGEVAPAATVTTPETPAAPSAQPPNNRNKLLLLIVVLLLLAGGAGAAWKLTRPKASPTANNQQTAPANNQPAMPVTQTTPGALFSTVKPLSDLGILPHVGDDCRKLGNTDCPAPAQVKYYQIGQRPDGTKLLAALSPSEGPNPRGFDTLILTQSPAGMYTLYGTYADSFYAAADHTKVTLDKADFPPELVFVQSATVNGQVITIPSGDKFDPSIVGYFINGLDDYAPKAASKPTKIASQHDKDYYDVVVQDSDSFQVHEIFGAASTVFAVPYRLGGSLENTGTTSTPQVITWTDNSKNTDSFTSQGPGCGSAWGYMTLKNVDTGSLIVAGKDKNGTAVYQLPTTNAFFQKVYTEDYAGGQYLDGKYQNLTKDQFQSRHAIVVSKNALGQYVAYLNATYIVGGGCAKPVDYLYPTTTTEVSVRVGAQITNSDPLYTASGWQHIIAQPDGRLTYQGKPYDSLFWEGLGLGSYPAITSGTIVPQNQVVTTIRQQLAAQGFNGKETDDFLTYWQPRLPKSPYVRLSWLTTDQLNTLAPLKVTPAPQTTIRTFLDAAGLNQPVPIAPQTFNAPARTGFTLVEWGGLLR